MTTSTARPRPVILAAALAAALLLPLLVVTVLVVAVLGPPRLPPADVPGAAARTDIPSAYLRLYLRAAAREGIDWAILAAIGKIETDHGRSHLPGVHSGTNRAGAAGPMQFEAGTWARYGIDGDGDGRRDIYDPADAIPAAARYLRASGAPRDDRRAIFAYNHATWYVEEVLDQARRYRASPDLSVPPDAAAGSRLERLITAADAIEDAAVPYCWGGGHGVTPARPTHGSYCWQDHPEQKVYNSPDVGLDCSSSVSLLLQAAGYTLPTLTSGQLARWGRPGPGRLVTIWANDEHVYLQIGDRYWGTSAENPRHGPGWHSPRDPTGFTARHPPGL